MQNETCWGMYVTEALKLGKLMGNPKHSLKKLKTLILPNEDQMQAISGAFGDYILKNYSRC